MKKRLNPSLKILGIVLNLIDSRKIVMEREIEQGLRDTYKSLIFNVRLTKLVKYEESPGFQKSIFEYDPKGPSADEFKAFIKEFIKRVSD